MFRHIHDAVKLRGHQQMGVTDSDTCRCAAPKQFPQHILQDYWDLVRQRKEVWPIVVALLGILWETIENLLRSSVCNKCENGCI